MVASMRPATITADHRTARVVELVGVAGAGKTSLVRTLGARDALIRADIAVPRSSYFRDIPSLLPTFVDFRRPWRTFLRKEMKRVLHLTTLYRRLDEARQGGQGIVLFDEGPVYMLARLRFLGGGGIDNPGFERWWRSTILQWAEVLELIVWLDADVRVLVERIRSRSGPAPINDTTDAALFAFIDRYRSCYDRVVGELTTAGGPRVITLDTGRKSIDALASRILTGIHAKAA
jgi:shikimate kinase